MRWRIVLVIAVVSSLVGVTADEASACVQVPAATTFIGTAESRDADVVVFRVERPVPQPDESGVSAVPGARVQVRYRTDGELIVLGRSYAVPVWQNGSDNGSDDESNVARDAMDGDCSLRYGTRNADGSFIAPPERPGRVVALVVGLALVALLAVAWGFRRHGLRRRAALADKRAAVLGAIGDGDAGR